MMSEVSYPRVAVLMATHNDGAWLQEAISSICNGTYPVDVHVVDDGSSPVAHVVVPGEASVSFHRLDRNVGLTRALNHGYKRIRSGGYDYIGRMDADDISYPQRLERQVRFLEQNQDVAIVGCWANYIDAETKEVVFTSTPPTDPKSIRRALFYNNCVLHPTWLVRASAMDLLDGYNEDFSVAQDYELLVRASANGLRLANLPEILLDYRISPNGISAKKRRKQLLSRWRVQSKYFAWLGRESWMGLLKTAILFMTPVSIVKLVKSTRHRKSHGASCSP